MALSNSFYHVGIVVPEVEPAQRHLTEMLGIEWGPVMERGSIETIYSDDGEILNPLRLSYSISPPHIELIQHTPNSIWEFNEHHSNLHHIGFWSDTLVADSQAMSRSRCPLGVHFRDVDGAPEHFVFHRSPLGFNVELVDLGLKPQVEATMLIPPPSSKP
jgi:hypothetical protein